MADIGIYALAGVAFNVSRNPAVVMTSEKRGIAQVMITAAIIPSDVINSRNHVLRKRSNANVITEGIKKPRMLRRGWYI